MNGFDPIIHNGTRAGAVRSMFEIFAVTSPADLRSALRLAAGLARATKRLKRDLADLPEDDATTDGVRNRRPVTARNLELTPFFPCGR